MKQTIFGITLGLLLVLTVFVGIEMKEKYGKISASDYVTPTEFIVDIDGVKYKKL